MSNYWDEEEEEEEDPQVEQAPRRAARRTRRASDATAQNNWYLLTGLIIGLALGLLISLVLSPVRYVDMAPSSLAANHKDTYRQMIALAYRSSGNLERARERMKLIDEDDAVPLLVAQAQRMLAENRPAQEARALALLASDLERGSSQVVQQEPSPEVVAGATVQVTEAPEVEEPEQTTTQQTVEAIQTPTAPLPTATATATATATRTPIPTFTPRPTATPMRVLDALYTLVSQREVCDGSMRPGLLEINVTGEDGEPKPGVRVVVTWQGGEDTFFTGLVPQISPGYADFVMTTGFTYSVKVGDVSAPSDGFSAKNSCGWQLEFSQQKSE